GSTAMTLAPLAETYRMWSTISSHEPHSVLDLTRPILSMMNVRFAFLNVSDPIPPGWHNVTFDMYTRLIENERVLPRAFVPRNVRIGVPSQQEVEQMAATNDFADQGWVAIEQPHVIEGPNGSGEANARWHRFRLHIDVVKHGPGFVVISEAAWRGWRAYLDGHRVEVHRADHAFLGVFVPDGKHTIVLHYLPQSFVIGRAITFATIALLVLYSTVTLFARLRGWSTSHPRRSAM
ncbi:MAG TPA: YfhO family protein, partial [Thermoanaerobaculia bacterium]